MSRRLVGGRGLARRRRANRYACETTLLVGGLTASLFFASPSARAEKPVSATPSSARADRARNQQAQLHHDAGKANYLSGSYGLAIREFEAAYALLPEPILLFNLAQAHRKNGDLENALLYFRRYLVALPGAPDRKDVETRIQEITGLINKANANGPKALASTTNPGADTGARYQPPPPPPPRQPAEVARAKAGEPLTHHAESAPDVRSRRFRAAVTGGVTRSLLAGSNIAGGSLVSLGVSSGYSWPVSRSVSCELGVAGTWSPMPFERYDHEAKKPTGEKGRSTLIGALGTIALLLPIADQLTAGPSVGLGVVWWTGLERADNPFTSGHRSSGAVALPTVRGGLNVAWSSDSFFLGADLGASFMKATSEGLKQEMSGLFRLELNGLVGVRF